MEYFFTKRMNKKKLLTIAGLVSFIFSYGQGTIKGTIKDKKGEPLIGVIVKLKSNATSGKTTDIDGNFSIKLNDSTTQTIVITYIGFDTINEQVKALNNEEITKDFTLQEYSLKLKEVQIVAKATKSKEYYMENIKKNSANSIDYISAETMRKTGDANVVAAVARVSGVSTNGNFITVRGIGDRFIRTTVNGSRIPTLDPLRNNIKLDMFPANMVDNVVITKTASPDLPGDWAGAYISVETKDYTDKLSVNVQTSFGYNTQSTFQDVVSSQRSSTDWLGYDNGLRNKNVNNFVATNKAPSQYDQFVALGLGNYFKSLGVTSDFSNSPASNNYFKLGLVQLGLLSTSQFNNPTAIAAARNAYNQGPYYSEAYNTINAGAVKFNQSLPDNWRTTIRKAPLNFSQIFSISNEVKLFGKPLGFFAGFRYSSATQYDPNSGYSRVGSAALNAKGIPTGVDTAYQKYSIETNEWTALFNVSYKYSKNNKISLMFMPNVNGVNKVAFGTFAGNSQSYNERQFYESRKQFVYQLKSEHDIPALKMKLVGNASYTRGSSIIPDYKTVAVPIDTSQQNAPVVVGDRYFRYLQENIFDSRVAAEIPLSGDNDDAVKKIKFGGAFQRIDRTYDQYDLSLDGPGGSLASQIIGNNLSSDPFSSDKFGFSPVLNSGMPQSTQLRYYNLLDQPNNHTLGYSNIGAGYAMMDYTFISKLRVTGGLRVEDAYLYTDVRKYDSLHLANNDPRRFIDQVGVINPGKLDAVNFLPSIGTIYKIKNDPSAITLNLRGNFSQTIARPSLRELSPVSAYDYEYNAQVMGNDSLKIVHINNYDVRLETYFKSGDNISISAFYKDFENFIELQSIGSNYTWLNDSKKAWLRGIEIEGKKSLTKYFEFRANLTFTSSQSTYQKKILQGGGFYTNGETVTGPLFGQAPYVINSIISYKLDKIGLVATASYNVQGARRVIDVGGNGIPDVYELPRNLLDMNVSKTLGKHFSIMIRANDILNSPIRRAYKFSEDSTPILYDHYRYGTTYTFTVIYKL
jgi:hypothetical protein